MKKVLIFTLISFFLFCQASFAANSKVRQFHGGGEVLTVDPVYSQVTIRHSAIKDLALDSETQFFVSSPVLLKGIRTGDLVEFDITDNKGEVIIEKIEKTGVAPPKNEGTALGQAVHDVLQGTGEVVRGVTEPLPPAHEVAKGVTSATDATGDALRDSAPEAKTKF